MTLIDTERGGLSEPNTFWTDQFHNEDAVRGYMEIGRELMEQTGGARRVLRRRGNRRHASGRGPRAAAESK
jgi:hypothetical protein